MKVADCIICFITDINECASEPCQNKGTCTDIVDGFYCSCSAGFEGVLCEIGNSFINNYHRLII